MSGIEVVRAQRVGFDQHGHSVSSDETYVKLSVSFRDLLSRLRGARLSAFISLALNEAEICLGHSRGLSIYDIEAQAEFDARTVLRAMQYLCKHNFAVALSERGQKGETLYRVADFAWFGEKRSKPQSSASNRGYDKMSHPAENVTGGVTIAPVVVGTDHFSGDADLEQQQQSLQGVGSGEGEPSAYDIFRATRRVFEPSLSRLSKCVAPERASEWCTWLEHAPDNFKNAVGFMISQLMRDPDAQPPGLQRKLWYAGYEDLVDR